MSEGFTPPQSYPIRLTHYQQSLPPSDTSPPPPVPQVQGPAGGEQQGLPHVRDGEDQGRHPGGQHVGGAGTGSAFQGEWAGGGGGGVGEGEGGVVSVPKQT